MNDSSISFSPRVVGFSIHNRIVKINKLHAQPHYNMLTLSDSQESLHQLYYLQFRLQDEGEVPSHFHINEASPGTKQKV